MTDRIAGGNVVGPSGIEEHAVESATVTAPPRDRTDEAPREPEPPREAPEENATGIVGDAANVGRGLLMGGADIIPGVSGGTVALILGIYERLVTAISRFDLDLIGHAKRREWSAAARHVDLRFLVTLGAGIAIGVGGLAKLMHHLLAEHPQPTYAAFFGLILASSLVVAGQVKRWSAAEVGLVVAGAGFAYWLVGLWPAAPPAGLGYVFLCGTIGICAMILPGISGAFILLIMGKYHDITGLIKEFVHGNVTLEALLVLGTFGVGCVVGLLAFSKLLRWLLAGYATATMALLCGFMIGSLRKIWPFKATDIEGVPTSEKFDFRPNTWPTTFGGTEWTCVGIAVVACAAVLVLHRVSQPSESR